MFIPYRVESTQERLPWANLTLVVACALVHTAVSTGWLSDTMVQAMILTDWNPAGLFGSMFLHANHVHFVGNMLFLFVFGNAVCERIGNLRYLGLYFLTGLAASASHLVISGQPAVGASGAIAGVLGLCIVMIPLAEVSVCFIFRLHVRTFRVPCILVLIIWAGLNVVGILLGGQGIAYWAHIGGFVAGLITGLTGLCLHLLPRSDDAPETVLDMFRGPQPYRRPKKTYVRRDGVPYALGQQGVHYTPKRK